MKNSDINKNKNDHDKCCKCPDESIIALKVFDQCRMQDCVDLGPVISAEKCTCIILQSGEDRFGRVILPNRPIYVPELVSKVKIESNSFETEKTEVLDISPSKLKIGFWDVEVKYTFIFKAQLFDNKMNKLNILCKSSECDTLKDCNDIKDYILGRVTYKVTVTLFGSKPDAPIITSDIFPRCEPPIKNSPHVLIESKAYPIDASLRSPLDECNCEEVLDDIYDEPTIFIFVTVGIFMLVKLFRLTSISVESNGYSIAQPYIFGNDSECDLFGDMKFPNNDFSPSIKRPNQEEC